jgi:putative ABC transport system permease protein
MDALFKDLKYSIRMFLKSPGFTITAVAAIALGIGGTTAIFSIVNTVLLKPLDVFDPERLLVLSAPNGGAVSPAIFMHWRAESSVLQEVSAYSSGVVNYTSGQVVEVWTYTRASADYFRCWGLSIVRGRGFTAQEDLPNSPLVAVISESLWKRHFAGDPRILGGQIFLNGESHTVIGIAGHDPSSQFGRPPDVYVPFQIDPKTTDQGNFFSVIARLRPGITLDRARARLRVSTAEYRARFPKVLGPKDNFSAKPFREDLSGNDRPLLLILSSAVSLVLLIACANVANLLLARATGRKREIAVRIALGAVRGRVIRQLLTESLLLSLAGGAAGSLLGYGGIRVLLAFNPGSLSMVGENGAAVAVDWRVMSFALAISLLTGIVFGLLPALRGSRADLNAALKDGGARSGSGLRQNKARATLVVSEVGLAVVLLVGSVLLIRSFVKLTAVDPGFETKNVVTMNVLVSGKKYSRSAAVAEIIRAGRERLRSMPGVIAAGATCCEPLSQGTYDMGFDIVDRPSGGSSIGQDVGWSIVSPGYFEAFKIPVKRGRTFSAQDDARSPAVVLISERMAKQFWPDGDPLGDRIAIGRGAGMNEFQDEPVRQIIGVVGDIRSEGLDAKPRPIMYVPQAQLPDAENAFFLRLLPLAWVVRTQSEPRTLLAAIPEQLRQSTGLPVTDVALMDHVVRAQVGTQRFSVTLMTVFGSIALMLAALGIYGVMAYTVAQRRQEIGIRMALGAQPGQVRSMVLRDGMSLTLAGVVTGLAAAWALARSIESLLYAVRIHDPIVFVAVPLGLSAVAMLAIWFPAHRASRVNPIDSIHYE